MFLHPLGLIALLGVPVVVALHLFRRRFRRHEVSALFLWSPQERSALAGRRREPLQRSASFWCELLAALLLGLAFAGPRGCGAGEATHLVVVLDGSASMGAISEEGELAELARAEVRARVARLPRGSRVTLIQSGPRPTVLAGPAAFTREALPRLESFRPTLARHDLAPAVALALELAAGGAVLVVGDDFRPDAFPPEVELVSIGRPVPNAAIVHATRRRSAGSSASGAERAHLTIANLAPDARSLEVVLEAGGERVAARTLEVAAGERAHLAFDLPEGTPPLAARLPSDALAIDDVAWLAPAPPRTLALGSTLPEPLALHLGLRSPGAAPSPVDRWVALLPDAIAAPDASLAHAVVSEGGAVAGEGWVLGLEAALHGAERQHLIGPFLIDKRHPLLEGVTLEGVVWSAAPLARLPGAPIVSAGDQPLLTEEQIGARTIFHANLDPARSSLHKSPDWPILLTNFAEARRRELPGPERTSLALGEPFVWRGAEPGEVVFRGAGEERRLATQGTVVVDDVALPGLYVLEREGRELCVVGYSFADAAESDLSGLAPGRRAAEASPATVRAGYTWLETLLLAAVAALLGLDWLVLARPARARQAAGLAAGSGAA